MQRNFITYHKTIPCQCGFYFPYTHRTLLFDSPIFGLCIFYIYIEGKLSMSLFFKRFSILNFLDYYFYFQGDNAKIDNVLIIFKS